MAKCYFELNIWVIVFRSSYLATKYYRVVANANHFYLEGKVTIFSYLTALARSYSIMIPWRFISTNFTRNEGLGGWWTVWICRHEVLWNKKEGIIILLGTFPKKILLPRKLIIRSKNTPFLPARKIKKYVFSMYCYSK